MRPFIVALLLCILFPLGSQAQEHHHETRTIQFPNVDGYLTLKLDLHMHSVFSDGAVWPSIRVEEAIRDGLDAISLTEHLEYQPHDEDIPHPDRNRAYQLALESAANSDLIIIPGAEVTRDMPPGHNNAIFIEDANPLLIDDARAVFEEANRQGAFVFWDHPNWTSHRADGVARLTDMHRALIADSLLHGIEVVNESTYSDEALEIALENNLTIVATSDIHGLIDWAYEPHQGGHRPVTLVFAEERNLESMEEALRAGRTAAWHKNILIGREENVMPLFHKSLQIESAAYGGDTQVLKINFDNQSDATWELMNESEYRFHEDTDFVRVPPGKSSIYVKTLERKTSVELQFNVLNITTAPGSHPTVKIQVSVD